MKIKELINVFTPDLKTCEHWSINIYNSAGMIRYGYCNSYYPLSDIHPAILDCEVISFYASSDGIIIKTEPIIEANYMYEERCLMDGYEEIDLKKFNTYNGNLPIIYAKETKNDGDWTFASIGEY